MFLENRSQHIAGDEKVREFWRRPAPLAFRYALLKHSEDCFDPTEGRQRRQSFRPSLLIGLQDEAASFHRERISRRGRSGSPP